ncbi:hypothetical protein GH714_013598 [Hevea brasiliensis]|uniref:Pectinesterase inhibitor domain-containing protein n=1 Tax=Hevea brasiliensis TaxID=3981 RepID=A0A6A6KND0_HEVBR|nr:hypothetical protein GH714_013598 [Hevea brasiliensis]
MLKSSKDNGIHAEATHTLKHINNLLQRSSSLSEKVRQELKACVDRYNVIIKGNVPQSIDALRTGHYKFAQEGTYDAATEAMSYEEFSGHHSKLSDMNIVVHDVSVVAVKIILSFKLCHW